MSGFAPNPAELGTKQNLHAVWKFEMPHPFGHNVTKVEMPERAEILHVAKQGENMMAWALVNSDAKLEERTFRVVGTGEDAVGDDSYYLGTVHDGAFVWHFFEEDLV